MPDGDIFQGGMFTFKIYEAYDEHAYGSDFGMLYNNLTFGIVSSLFEDKFVWEAPDKRDENIKLWFIAVSASFGGSAIPQTVDVYKERRSRKYKQVGEPKAVRSVVGDFLWEDTIIVDINPKGLSSYELTYLWGLHIDGVESYHELHLSSAYADTGLAIGVLSKAGETGTAPMLIWKSRTYINENTEYTNQLSGTYRSMNISPLRLINDYEGNIYRLNNGTWQDKRGYWKAVFTQFKALKNLPSLPVKCDYSPYDYNDDYCKEFTSGYVASYVNRINGWCL
jgi:hypothetical protein